METNKIPPMNQILNWDEPEPEEPVRDSSVRCHLTPLGHTVVIR